MDVMNQGWLFFFGAAYLVALWNLVRILRGKMRRWEVLIVVSLGLLIGSILSTLGMVYEWAILSDFEAIEEVIPTTSPQITLGSIICFVLNCVIVKMALSRKNM